jgi:hypothetical protein
MIKQVILTEDEYQILYKGYKKEKKFIGKLIFGLRDKLGKQETEDFITNLGYTIPTGFSNHTNPPTKLQIGNGVIEVNLLKDDYSLQD